MRPEIIAIIQARTGARRLPGKVLLGLEGKSVLWHVINRVRRSKNIEETIVATTMLKCDLEIVKFCSGSGVRVYCGSENDVLDRYYQAARLVGASHIVRITADCPMIDYRIIDDVVALHLKGKNDYTSNVMEESYPDGEDVEIFTFESLKKAWANARLSSEREHVTAYIRNHPEKFKLFNLKYPEDLSDKRWTLDEENDYKFIRLIYSKIYKRNRFFGMKEILKLLDEHPEYEYMNNRIKRNEGYLKSLREDKIIKMDYIGK